MTESDSVHRREELVAAQEAPVVSVVIPAYNRSDLLPETLRSVYAQTTSAPIEIIVVDDGSKEDILSVLARHTNPRFALRYVRQHNAGPSVARGRGAEEARGEFVQWLDSDDLLERTKLEDHLRALAARPDAHLATGIWTRFDSDSRTLLSQHGPWRASSWPILPCFMRLEHWATGAALVRRSALSLFGPWPAHMRQYEDWLWWINGGRNGARTVHVPRPALHLREHRGPRLSWVDGRAKQAECFSVFVRGLQQMDWSEVPSCRRDVAELSFDEAVKWLVAERLLTAEEAACRAFEASVDVDQQLRFKASWALLKQPASAARLGAGYGVVRAKIQGAMARLRRPRADAFWRESSAIFLPKPREGSTTDAGR